MCVLRRVSGWLLIGFLCARRGSLLQTETREAMLSRQVREMSPERLSGQRVPSPTCPRQANDEMASKALARE